MVDRMMLKLELVKRGWSQATLAEKLRVPPTTLSGWINGRHPAPEDFKEKIEKLLKVPEGTLTK